MNHIDCYTNDALKTAIFKLTVSFMSVLITFPAIYNHTDRTFYVTLCVFAFGKLIDQIDSFINADNDKLHFLFLAGILDCIILSSACLMTIAVPFSNISTPVDASVSSSSIPIEGAAFYNLVNSTGFCITLFTLASFNVFIEIANVIWMTSKMKQVKEQLPFYNK